jgi:hypothetical protein
MSPFNAAREFQIALDALNQFLENHPQDQNLWTDVEAEVYRHLMEELSEAARNLEG